MRIVWSITMASALIGSTLCAAANIYFVDDNSAPNGSGSLNHPFNRIQQAIDAASDGDEVRVARGTYFENIIYRGKAITIKSEKPTNSNWVRATIIDGGDAPVGSTFASVVTFNANEDALSILDGFTLTHGTGRQANVSSALTFRSRFDTGINDVFMNLAIQEQVNNELLAEGLEPEVQTQLVGILSLGGAIYSPNASPTIRNCYIVENSATRGGGVFFSSSGTPKIANCRFERNTSESGGAIYNISVAGASNPEFTNCDFDGNSSLGGGAIYNYSSRVSSPIFNNCIFSHNQTTGGGGAVVNSSGTGDAASNPEFRKCKFIDNRSGSEGGAVYNSAGTGDSISSPKFNNCLFSDNEASGSGGALNNSAGTGRAKASPEFADCTFVRSIADMAGGAINNHAGTGDAKATPLIINCAFSQSYSATGGLMYLRASTGRALSAPVIKYSTVVDSRAIRGGIIYASVGTGSSSIAATMSHCNVRSSTANEIGGLLYAANSSSGAPLNLHFDNCVIDGNFSPKASLLYCRTYFAHALADFTNCTIANCLASNGRLVHLIGGEYESLTAITFRNCIVWNNQWQGDSPFLLEGDAANRHVLITYSDFQGLGTLTSGPDYQLGPGNIESDPEFVSAGGQNGIAGDEDDRLAVLPGSPVIDAGNNSALPFDTDGDTILDRDLDVSRSPRFVDDPTIVDTGVPDSTPAVVDMGAYEFNCIDSDGDGRIEVCHRSNDNSDGHLISIPFNALRAHLIHGDTCGACP